MVLINQLKSVTISSSASAASSSSKTRLISYKRASAAPCWSTRRIKIRFTSTVYEKHNDYSKIRIQICVYMNLHYTSGY